jgi:hypothetical protein
VVVVAVAIAVAVFAGGAGASFAPCSGNKTATTLSVTSASATTTAGNQYTVTVEAVNTKFACRVTNYTGTVTLTGGGPEAPVSYSFLPANAGIRNDLTIVLTKAGSGRTITATDNSSPQLGGSLTGITVLPGPLNQLSFSGSQPVDTKVGTPIYSFCVGSGSAPPANPCNLTTSPNGSRAVAVVAQDAWGNTRSGDTVNLQYQTPPSGPLAAFDPAVSKVTDSAGVASFGDSLTISSLGTYQLQASVTGTRVIGTSNAFRIVDDVVACSGKNCATKATPSDHNQLAYGKVAAGRSNFQTTLVTSQFNAPSGDCVGSYLRASGSDVEIRAIPQVPTADPLTQTQPSFAVALIIPNATLQAESFQNRAINTWQVCVGALWIGSSSEPGSGHGWLAKLTGPNATALLPTSPGLRGYYWGWAPDCSALPPGSDPGNPCISLRTKNASQLGAALGLNAAGVAALPFQSSDLAVVVSMKYPWDMWMSGP